MQLYSSRWNTLMRNPPPFLISLSHWFMMERDTPSSELENWRCWQTVFILLKVGRFSPSSLTGHTHWKCGNRNQASYRWLILVSTVLTKTSCYSRTFQISNQILDGSSQWVIVRNINLQANLEHIGNNIITFLIEADSDFISSTYYKFLRYIDLSRFTKTEQGGFVLSCHNVRNIIYNQWSEVRLILDKIHKHACGNAMYTYFQLLLENWPLEWHF